MGICCKDSVHISAGSSFWASLKWLRKRMFLICFDEHIAVLVTEYFPWIHTLESEIWMSIDVGKEILPSSSVVKSGWKQLMKLLVISVERVNFVLKVIFNSSELVLLLSKIATLLLDGLQIEQMFLVLHFDYIECYKHHKSLATSDHFLSYVTFNIRWRF